MVYKLKPLELTFDFEDRSYALGDTVNVEVRLLPNGDVDVREARVDLVLEERFSGGSGSPMPGSVRGSCDWTGVDAPTALFGASSMKQRGEAEVVSQAVLLENTSLRTGMPSSQRVILQVPPSPPKHFEEAVSM